MKTALLRGLLVAVIGIGGLTLTKWEGNETLNKAKAKIQAYAESTNIFKSNETKLIQKIEDLKAERDSLREELETNTGLLEEEKQDLISQLEQLEAEIKELEEDYSEAENTIADLENDIKNQNMEIEQANKLAAELQAYIDGLEVVQPTDISSIVGEEVTTPGTPEEGETTPEDGETPEGGIQVIETSWDGSEALESEYVKVELIRDETDGNHEIRITSLTNDPTINPLTVLLDGNETSIKLAYNNPKSFDFSKNGSELIIKSAGGDTLMIISLNIQL